MSEILFMHGTSRWSGYDDITVPIEAIMVVRNYMTDLLYK